MPALARSPARPWLATALLVLVPASGAQVVVEQGLVLADNPNGSRLGKRVAIDDGRLVATLPSHPSGGALFTFEAADGSPWQQVHKLTGLSGLDAIALSGDRLVVGSTSNGSGLGGTRSFRWTGSAWQSEAQLYSTPSPHLHLDGDVLAVSRGKQVEVFRHDGLTWVSEAVLDVNVAGGQSNARVLVQGDELFVGVPNPTTAVTGEVHVYAHASGNWSLQQTLTAPNPMVPNGLGSALAVDGDTLAVGAPNEYLVFPGGFSGEGAVYVFDRSGTSWTHTRTLTASDAGDGDDFGQAVALERDTLLIGAPQRDSATDPLVVNSGGVYVFMRDGTAWSERAVIETRDTTPASQGFGESVALDGVHGAIGDDLYTPPGGVPNSGAVAMVLLATAPPTGVGYCTAGTSASGCQAGIAARGTPSASADSGFVVWASGAEVGAGLFFFGTSGQQTTPWGNGSSFQCVVPPVRRAGLLGTGQALEPCEGLYFQDLNARWCPACPGAASNPGAGALTQLQFWYRDPLNTSNQTTSLSDAIEFQVAP